MKHLDLEKIFSYIEDQLSEKDRKEIEDHISSCVRCQDAYKKLKSLGSIIGHSFEEEKPTNDCPDDWEIREFIKEKASPETSKKMSDHIKNCSYCIDRAAKTYKCLLEEEKHFEAPQIWKEKAIDALASKSKLKTKEKKIVQYIFDFFHNITFPLPALPGYVLAALAIVLLIWTNLPEKSKIITIPSTEKMIIKDSEIPSTLGFVNIQEKRMDNGMKLKIEGKDISFQWNPIEDVSQYKFSLLEQPEAHVIFTKSDIKEPKIFIGKNLIEEQKIYAWVIEGKRIDGKYFEYAGKFIFTR